MLQIQDLNFRYQFKKLLHNLSFSVSSGELLHITGPNGCGKTTLMSILAGLRREDSGTISYTLQGKVLEDRRLGIEYLPAEANALFGKMDAMSNLRFWLKLRGLKTSDAEIVKILEKWDLNHPLLRSNFPVERFSTGMKRRLALSRLELSQTSCWLLDEPLYGLDTKAIASFQDLLGKHLDKGGIGLIVSHDVAPLQKFKIRHLDLIKEAQSS